MVSTTPVYSYMTFALRLGLWRRGWTRISQPLPHHPLLFFILRRTQAQRRRDKSRSVKVNFFSKRHFSNLYCPKSRLTALNTHFILFQGGSTDIVMILISVKISRGKPFYSQNFLATKRVFLYFVIRSLNLLWR